MSGHTPGRWQWWTSCSWRRLRSQDGMHTRDVLMPCVQKSDGQPDIIVSKEDMALIEAAPELLEAMEGLLDHYVALVNSTDCGFWDPEAEEEVRAARAAIAKAKGQTT